MTDTDEVRDNPEEETVETARPESGADTRETDAPKGGGVAAEPEAGPREILIGVIVVAVMLVGMVYAYNQGLETGTANGRQEVLEETPRWVEPLREARVAGGIRLSEGQQVRVRVTGPGEEVQETLMSETPGEQVVVLLRGPGREQAKAGAER